MPQWAQILLNVFVGTLREQGKTAQADLVQDGLAAFNAGKNVDAAMLAAAQQWAANGAPSIDEIEAARKSIQAQL